MLGLFASLRGFVQVGCVNERGDNSVRVVRVVRIVRQAGLSGYWQVIVPPH